MNKKTRKLFTWCLVVAMLITQMLFANVAFAATSYAGTDRYQTALKVVQAGWTTSDNAVIARGDDLADALAAAPLAYAKGKAPILLTETGALPTGVMDELTALGVKNVYIVGGTGAVSQAVQDALAAKFTVKRLSGADRYATSLAVAQEAFPTAPAKAVLVNGYAVADALSISSIAAYNGMPILLADKDTKSADIAAYLAGKTVYAVGGTGVLSDANIGTATRLSGADRYATNVAVLNAFALDYSKVFVAVGEDANCVDALGGAALAAVGNNPMVLVNTTLPTATATLLQGKVTGTTAVYTLGGVVPASVATSIEALKPTTLEVKSVTVLNAKQIQVTFSRPVQPGIATGGAQVVGNYVYGAATNPTRVTLNSDNTVATLTFGAGFVADLDKYVQFAVSGIKTADGTKTLTSYKAPLLVADDQLPTVTSVAFTSPNVVVDFSEPLKLNAGALDKATVAVDGVAVTPTLKLDSTTDGLQGAVELSVTGLSDGAHRLDIIGAQDLAGNIMADYSASLNVAADTTAPTVTSLTSDGSNIKVKFSEPVVSTTLNGQATKTVWLTLDGTAYYCVAADATDTTNTEFVYNASALITGSVSWKNVSVVVSGAQDASGNSLVATSAKTLLITKDTTAPTVASTTVDGAKIIIKYNEAIAQKTAFTAVNVNFVDKDGVVYDYKASTANDITVTPAYVYDANNDGDTTDAGENYYMVLTVTDADLLSGGKLLAGNYTVTIPNTAVQDAATNFASANYNVTFSVASTSATSATLTCTPSQISTGVLAFTFGNDLTASALKLNNFTINGQPLPAGTDLYFYGAKNVVYAELPAGYLTVTGYRTVAVANIADEDGNTLTTGALAGSFINLNENVSPVAQTVALSTDTVIKVQMSETLNTLPVTVAGVEVYVNGTKIDTTTNALSYSLENGAKGNNDRLVITATNANTFAPTQTIVVKFLAGTNITDAVGNVLAAGQVQK